MRQMGKCFIKVLKLLPKVSIISSGTCDILKLFYLAIIFKINIFSLVSIVTGLVA